TPKIELISNVSGQMVSGSQMSQAQYWCEHILQPVRFSQGMTTVQLTARLRDSVPTLAQQKQETLKVSLSAPKIGN
ncbi:hypothetical protein, partial [Nostoc sp. CHAB 5715]|uniref:hypothetical protein n=1 Tax=Nostoc sp. CHAB 5715 TaxID=2780400 RepID=UPI001E2A23E7